MSIKQIYQKNVIFVSRDDAINIMNGSILHDKRGVL